jgi:predicted MFS family arabinose efflux permease
MTTTSAEANEAGDLRPPLGRRQVHAVAACYFVASFAALGLPPYLTAILPELGDPGARWAGALYVVPTVFGGLGAPLWGRLADRFGRKRLLLRAQLGLTVAFLLAGWADSLAVFTAALVLQGVLGGTFAASNGYLAAALRGPELSRALTLMQGSARAALVAAPIAVGALSPWVSPHRQYALLAALPLAAALLLARLPEPAGRPPARPDAPPGAEARGPTTTLLMLYALEFAFVFSTVISFPYLVSLTEDRIPGIPPVASGVLFALPHLCYLASATAVHAAVQRRATRTAGGNRLGIATGFGLIALGLAGHGAADSLAAFVIVRIVLGAGLTLGLVCLAVLAAECAEGRPPGAMFGWRELATKSGAVAAGLTAAAGNSAFGPVAPVLTGTAIASTTILAIALATALPALVRRLGGAPPRTRWSR